MAGIDQQAPETTISCLIAGIADGQGTLISLAPGITDRITVSIGIASAPNQAHDRVTLLRLADEALYRAKQAGRNRVVYAGSADAPAPPAKAQAKVANPAGRKTPTTAA